MLLWHRFVWLHSLFGPDTSLPIRVYSHPLLHLSILITSLSKKEKKNRPLLLPWTQRRGRLRVAAYAITHESSRIPASRGDFAAAVIWASTRKTGTGHNVRCRGRGVEQMRQFAHISTEVNPRSWDKSPPIPGKRTRRGI